MNSLIKTVAGSIVPKSVTRIGREDNIKRPIKVVFFNEENKMKVMNNLSGLKGKEQYKKISVTEDYTLRERQKLKEFIAKAHQRNLEDRENKDYQWKVRGIPKIGLRLIRICNKDNNKIRINNYVK